MAAIYSNFQQGTLSSSITNVSTTLSSTAFANLPAVASPDVIYIVLDPAQTAGAAEIVTVTAHTASSTSVTVTRGAQSTTARSHASGITWSHAWTKADGDVMPHRVLTTKGDILIGSGSNNIDRLPVGTNNYALVADSTQTLGVKWAQAASSVATLTDVTLGTLAAGEFLRYNGTAWVDSTDGSTLTSLNATNLASGTVAAARLPAFSGDATSTAGTASLTLATVNSNTGAFGSSTAIPTVTVNGKGLITAVTTNAVVAPAGTLSGTTLNSTVVSSSLTSVGTLTSLTVSGALTLSQATGAQMSLTGGTSNWIAWAVGSPAHEAAPAFTTRSIGTKLLLGSYLAADRTDFAIGLQANHMWFSAPNAAADGFKWYSGTTNTLTLTAAGALDMTIGTLGTPTTTTRSAGTRLVLWSSLGVGGAEYAIGMGSSMMWFSTDTNSASFRWYAGTANTMILSGAGTLGVSGSMWVNGTTTQTVVWAAGGDATARGVYIDNVAPTTQGSDGDIWLRYV